MATNPYEVNAAPALRPADETTARLERLLEHYSVLLRQQIRQHCPRHLGIQVSDIEQEARVRLWKVLQRETELRDPASYIYRVAASATIDAVRRVLARREEQLHVEGEDDESPIDFIADPDHGPDAVTERRELMSAVSAALASLSEKRRRAVELYLQGLSVIEIAELLRWSEPKTRNLVYRGLDDLRAALRREGIEYP